MDIELVEDKQYPYLVDCEQLSDEWFKLRLSRITASKFPDLMKSSRQRLEWTDTQLKILKEYASQILTGQRKESFTNSAMQWGIDTEDEAREFYELETMQIVDQVGFYVISDNLGDSPDGIIKSSNKVWECKCPASTTHLDYLLDPKKLFDKYKWQCYGHMMATGYTKGDIISYDPRFLDDNKKMVIYSFELVEEDMQLLKDRLAQAVEKMIEFTA